MQDFKGEPREYHANNARGHVPPTMGILNLRGTAAESVFDAASRYKYRRRHKSREIKRDLSRACDALGKTAGNDAAAETMTDPAR